MQPSPSPAPIPKQELSDGLIVLRPCRAGDAPLLHDAVRESMAELSPWLAWCHPGYALADAEESIRVREEDWAAGRAYSFAINGGNDGRFLGGILLCAINRTHNFANIGYWVRRGDTGRGVATRAVRLIARFGFERLGFTRLEIGADVTNAASRRVAEKCGAKREGVLRNGISHHGTPRDCVMYSLIPSDLEGSPAGELIPAPPRPGLSHRRATAADCPQLGAMNHQLIHDEGHRNPMSVPELETRMRGWLAGEYTAILFEHGGAPVAYALFRPDGAGIYLRQMFVVRERRRQGIGRTALQRLVNDILPPGVRVTLEVLANNRGGHEFWRAVGFADYAVTLELSR